MNECNGNSSDHCCWFGTVCPHLEENTVKGRRWACGLFREENLKGANAKQQTTLDAEIIWTKVYARPEWQAVYQKSQAAGYPITFRCGDWPPLGETCATCGAKGI